MPGLRKVIAAGLIFRTSTQTTELANSTSENAEHRWSHDAGRATASNGTREVISLNLGQVRIEKLAEKEQASSKRLENELARMKQMVAEQDRRRAVELQELASANSHSAQQEVDQMVRASTMADSYVDYGAKSTAMFAVTSGVGNSFAINATSQLDAFLKPNIKKVEEAAADEKASSRLLTYQMDILKKNRQEQVKRIALAAKDLKDASAVSVHQEIDEMARASLATGSAATDLAAAPRASGAGSLDKATSSLAVKAGMVKLEKAAATEKTQSNALHHALEALEQTAKKQAAQTAIEKQRLEAATKVSTQHEIDAMVAARSTMNSYASTALNAKAEHVDDSATYLVAAPAVVVKSLLPGLLKMKHAASEEHAVREHLDVELHQLKVAAKKQEQRSIAEERLLKLSGLEQTRTPSTAAMTALLAMAVAPAMYLFAIRRRHVAVASLRHPILMV